MVKHVLLFKLREYSPENCEKLVSVLRSMKGKVPSAMDVEAHADFLHSERSFDVALIVTLKEKADLDAYQKDPYHCDTVKTYVHSVVEKSVVVDYEY